MSIIIGHALDVLSKMNDASVDCVVTSPPYYAQRNYAVGGQIGLESSPELYIEHLVTIFRERRRVLKPLGTFWLNLGDKRGQGKRSLSPNDDKRSSGKQSYLGDSFASSKVPLRNKQLLLLPSRLAIALCDDGWLLRSAIIWEKTNSLPESVTDRPTDCYEHVFLFSKQEHYWYDADAIRTPHKEVTKKRAMRGRKQNKYSAGDGLPGGVKANSLSDPKPFIGYEKMEEKIESGETPLNPLGVNRRNVWQLATAGYNKGHFAVMPLELARLCVVAGCPKGGIVLDPFGGVGTTAIAALQNLRNFQLIELNPDYAVMAQKRIDRQLDIGVQLKLRL